MTNKGRVLGGKSLNVGSEQVDIGGKLQTCPTCKVYRSVLTGNPQGWSVKCETWYFIFAEGINCSK